MRLSLFVVAILGVAALIFDLWLKRSTDEKLKDKLLKFYLALGKGDWAVLFRQPAAVLLSVMDIVLGRKTLGLRYMAATLLVSVSMTLALFALSMIWSYIHAYITEVRCEVPGISQFLEIPAYMGRFLVYITAINAVVDYVSWSASHWGLRVVSRSSGARATVVAMALFAVGFGTLWCLYAIYLPLTIAIEANDRGIPFGVPEFRQILFANLGNINGFFHAPDYLFVISCSAGRSIFSLSFISTMQILAAETLMPVLFLLFSCVGGLILYATRPVTERIMSGFIERIIDSGKTVFGWLAAFIAIAITLLRAIADYVKSSTP